MEHHFKKKPGMAALLLVLGALTSLQAQDTDALFPLWEDQLTTWMTANPEKTLGDMTPQEALGIMALSRENLARRDFLRRGLAASFHFPGSGHFMAGDSLGGTLFTAGSVTIAAAGIWAAANLLPGDLIYFNPLAYSLDTVEKKLKSYSLMEYFPSLSALGAAAVAQGILGLVSVNMARPLLIKKASGPEFQVMGPGAGMMFGMGMRY